MARPFQAFLVMFLNSLLFGLAARFARQRQEFERLISKAAETPSITRIGNLEMEDINGTKYKIPDKQSIISPESWREYREAFQKTGMTEGFYRYPATGEMQFVNRPFLSKIGPVETFYGYLYCPPSTPEQHFVHLPCRDRKQEWKNIEYRYKRIDSEWYIVKIFQRRLHRPSSE
jgi:hypothetical protein